LPTNLSLAFILNALKMKNQPRLPRMGIQRPPEQGEKMTTKAAVLTLLILLSSSAPALARKNPALPFFLPAPLTVDGAEVGEGMYQLVVKSNNSSVRVELWKDGRFVATAHGTWVKSGMKYKDNTILLRVNPDGSRSLIEIRLAGVAKTIVLRNNSENTIQYSAK
jgi:hypothetical protein